VILTAWAVAAAAVLLLFRRFDPVRWLATAASILAGVFFPVSVLPEPLRLLAYLLPLTYALDALRAALLLGRPLAALGTPLLALGLFALVLVPGSLALASYAVGVLRRQAGVGLA
jgi:ABC-2 type transport system permease protein